MQFRPCHAHTIALTGGIHDSGHIGSSMNGGHSTYSAAIGFMGEADIDYNGIGEHAEDLPGFDDDSQSLKSFGWIMPCFDLAKPVRVVLTILETAIAYHPGGSLRLA